MTDLPAEVSRAIAARARRLAHGDAALADDLEQVGLLAALEASTGWREGLSDIPLAAFLVTRARQRQATTLRRELRHRAREVLTDAAPARVEPGDPDQVLAARDLHRRVLGLLAALPPATSDLVARRPDLLT